MNAIFKVALLVAAASLTLTAIAGEKPGYEHGNGHGHRNGHGNGHGHGNGPQKYPYYELYIRGLEGSLGSQDLSVFLYCHEFPDPDNVGGTAVYGGANIDGRIATDNYISESESYEGFDACPVNDTIVSKESNQSITVSIGGNIVTADCSGQVIERTSLKIETKQPGQKEWETSKKTGQGNIRVYDEFAESTCTITAMDSTGNTEIFAGIEATAFIRKGFRTFY